jgi:hypothetical protein
MPIIRLPCPSSSCGSLNTLPPLLLERWERKQWIECLACGRAFWVLSEPTEVDGLWQAETRPIDPADFPFGTMHPQTRKG